MQVRVNGQEVTIPDPPTLENLVATLRPPEPYALAVNEEFIQRAAYWQYQLTDGDRIEIVQPSAGG